MPPERHAESPDNKPPAPVFNGAGRISNIGHILANIEKYNYNSVLGLLVSVIEAMKVFNTNLDQLQRTIAENLDAVDQVRSRVHRAIGTTGAEIDSLETEGDTIETAGDTIGFSSADEEVYIFQLIQLSELLTARVIRGS